MDARSIAAVIFAVVAVGAAGFQIALAAGAPWGDYTMGGRFPGRFPLSMRIAAVVQSLALLALAGIVLTRAGMAPGTWVFTSAWPIWAVVAFSGLSLILNSLTPSKNERRLWVPVALVMLATSLIVALAG